VTCHMRLNRHTGRRDAATQRRTAHAGHTHTHTALSPNRTWARHT
jgi:hypothetical protein